MTSPTARTPLPVPLDASAATRPSRFAGPAAALPAGFSERLRQVCPDVTDGDAERVEAGRDWWPISAVWALEGRPPALPDLVARPAEVAQVSELLRICDEGSVPVTVFAGASGVSGGSVPLHGGLSLDLTGLAGIEDVDDASLLVEVRAGTFGAAFEEELRGSHGLTLGHWPQSVELSTVGGWLACRGAGQLSTRYGKIEDMVVDMEVVLAGGRVIRTGARSPRSATGPDLTRLFVGSEGTLGVITSAVLRCHPAPLSVQMATYGFGSFEAGLDACRRILRRGATPAVLRLYDHVESARSFGIEDRSVLVVVDEGDTDLVDAVMRLVSEESVEAVDLGTAPAEKWLGDRNHLPPLDALARGGIVADTVEIAATWSALPGIYRSAVDALRALEPTIAASAHQSHAYTDGGCLYFTFAGRPEPAAAEAYYRDAFDAVTAATIAAGGAISHHHGIGLNRGAHLRQSLGPAFAVLQGVKDALDPKGILNPGKLGLRDPFDAAPSYPEAWL